MKLMPVLAALVLVAATTATQAADTPGSNPAVRAPSAAERLASARKAIDAKDWSAALRELTAAEREEPRNADVQNLLGYSYRKRANPDLPKAISHYQAALRLDPRHKGAHEYLGDGLGQVLVLLAGLAAADLLQLGQVLLGFGRLAIHQPGLAQVLVRALVPRVQAQRGLVVADRLRQVGVGPLAV